MPDIITIDGPAASGKSTIARNLAEVLGFRYVNSGNYYRAITHAILRDGVALDDADRLKELLERIRLEDGGGDRLTLDGEDVSHAIRGREVTSMVSPVAKVPLVRDRVNRELRRVASRHNSVVEGRDIGTVVFPSALLKVFLVASIEERARRRKRDYDALGVQRDLKELMDDIARRDDIDSTRQTAPLRCSEDALVIDSTAMSIDTVVEHVRAAFTTLVSGRTGSACQAS
jgi:cytidylate kinase